MMDIANSRLVSQQIAVTKFSAVKKIASWMAAMQAQDFAMVKWALGTQLVDATDATLEAAINSGEVVRTHLLRPTWHLVSADDLCWMLDLTAPRIKASLRSRHRELELSSAVVTKSKKIFEKAALDYGQSLGKKVELRR
jgi:hypothetical protein